jgi:hypothetical protein
MTEIMNQVHVVYARDIDKWLIKAYFATEEDLADRTTPIPQVENPVGQFDTQEAAIEYARDYCRENVTEGKSLELFIHGEDGNFREKDSYGNDPKDIEG